MRMHIFMCGLINYLILVDKERKVPNWINHCDKSQPSNPCIMLLEQLTYLEGSCLQVLSLKKWKYTNESLYIGHKFLWLRSLHGSWIRLYKYIMRDNQMWGRKRHKNAYLRIPYLNLFRKWSIKSFWRVFVC